MAFIAAIWTNDGKEEEEEEEAEEGDLFVFVELGAHVADHGLHFGLAEAAADELLLQALDQLLLLLQQLGLERRRRRRLVERRLARRRPVLLHVLDALLQLAQLRHRFRVVLQWPEPAKTIRKLDKLATNSSFMQIKTRYDPVKPSKTQ